MSLYVGDVDVVLPLHALSAPAVRAEHHLRAPAIDPDPHGARGRVTPTSVDLEALRRAAARLGPTARWVLEQILDELRRGDA